MLRVTVAELAALEEGTARIDFDMMIAAAEYLGVSERYFYMGFKPSPPPTGPGRRT